MSFTEQEWQELEYEALSDQMTRALLAETPENQGEIMEEHKEISEAYNAMVGHKHQMTHTGEWENLQNDVAFGSFEEPCEINHKWDYHEMFYDMNAFESDVNAQKILAAKHQHIPEISYLSRPGFVQTISFPRARSAAHDSRAGLG